MTIEINAISTASYSVTPLLRWRTIHKSVRVLEQCWQGSDGTQVWELVPVSDERPTETPPAPANPLPSDS